MRIGRTKGTRNGETGDESSDRFYFFSFDTFPWTAQPLPYKWADRSPLLARSRNSHTNTTHLLQLLDQLFGTCHHVPNLLYQASEYDALKS